MDPEDKKLLEETLRLGQENNQMLRSIRRSLRISRIVRLVYWVFIIGSAIGAYYFVQPHLDQVMEIYGGAKDTLNIFN